MESPLGSALTSAGGASIREKQKGHHPLKLVVLLKVQRAKLDAQDEHLGLGFGADDMARCLEGVHSRVAAHEADDRTLDGGVETNAIDHLQIDAWRRKSRARGDDQMRDFALAITEVQRLDGALGENGRLDLIFAHAFAG